MWNLVQWKLLEPRETLVLGLLVRENMKPEPVPEVGLGYQPSHKTFHLQSVLPASCVRQGGSELVGMVIQLLI